MEKLYKRLEGLAIKWRASLRDEFLIARIRLTFYYSLTALVILGGSSFLLYNIILSNLSQSIWAEGMIDPFISQEIIDRAQDILISRFIAIDAIILLFVVIIGFLLTYKTLEPIKSNMEKQRRFIADASHELRTPIAVIMSGLEVNLSNKKLDIGTARKTLENTLEEMREFSKLSNNLLDISKSSTQARQGHESVNISALLNYIVEKNRNPAEIKNIKIINTPLLDNVSGLPKEPRVLGDKMELGRVFFNILDNAVKYSVPGGEISVSEKISSNKYVVSIIDDGIGMDKSALERVFEPFFRGDSSRNTEGSGLGLTLSKKIIEDHRGDISIKSQPNKGTSVVITLPLASQ